MCPRPQLQRDGWMSLNGTWDFAFDRDAVWGDPKSVEWNSTIIVPFSPETAASGIEDTGFYCAVWYRRNFTRPRLEPGHRLVLHFGAVDYNATVWVNGTKVCSPPRRLHPLPRRHHRGTQPRRPPGDRRQRRGRSRRSRQTPRQAGLEAGAALHLVSAHHRHLADRLARGRSRVFHRDSSAGRPIWSVGRSDSKLTSAANASDGLSPRRSAACRRAGARRRHLLRRCRRSAPAHRPFRSRHRRLPQRPALESLLAHHHRRRARTARRAGQCDRPRAQLHRLARHRHPGRPLHPQRPARSPCGSCSTRATGRRPASPRPTTMRFLQDVLLAKKLGFNGVRKHQKIENPRYPLLGRPAGSAGLGRDAQRLSLHSQIDRAAHARVDRGLEARRQPSLHRGLGAVQRVLGRARPARQSRPAPLRSGALSPHQNPRPHAPRDRQRRLGERCHRHHRHPRLR